MPKNEEPIIFYGYVLAVAGIVIQLMVWGTYYSFGVFFKPMSHELGWTRAMTSGGYALAYLVYGGLSVVAGRVSDRLGPKVVLIASGFFLGLGYLLMSHASALWHLYLFYGVFAGIGLGCADTPVLSTIARWFVKSRGTLTGIAKAGAGVGMFILPLLAGWVTDNYSWRPAFTVFGSLSMTAIIVAALFFKTDPNQTGHLPYGAIDEVTADANASPCQFSLWEAMATSQFWILCSIWFLAVFCVQVMLGHIAPHVSDLGISETVGASMLSLIGFASILGRLGLGSISDWLGNRNALFIALCFLAVSLILLQFASKVWLFYLLVILYGVAHGAFFTLISPTLAEIFGLRALGSVVGAVLLSATLGGAIGPFLAGHIFDKTDSYRLVFLLCMALSVVAIILVFFVRPIKPEGHGNVMGIWGTSVNK